MSVASNSPLTSANTNSAFVSRTQDTNTVGVVALENTSDPNSGASVANPQRAHNETFDAVGMTGIGDATRKNYSSNNVVANGDSHKVAVGKIDAEFHATTGHAHSGAAGDGAPVSAANLADFNNLFTEFQAFSFAAASGTSINISTPMSGKSPSVGAAGVLVNSPENISHIVDSSTNTYLEDAEGQRVYGRITEAAGVWTLSFFTNEAGTETAHSLASTNILVIFREIFTGATRPTIPSNPLEFGTLDVTADVKDASATQRGVVSTGTQAFAGAKTFNDALAFLSTISGSFVTDSATTGSNATLPAPTKLITRVTNVSLVSISDITAPSLETFFILINKTGVTLSLVNADVAATDILTGTGANLDVADDASVWLVYDTTSSRWHVVGGSGGSSASALPEVQDSRQTGQSISAATQIAPAADQDSLIFVVGNAGPVVVTNTTPVAIAGMTIGQELTVFGTSDTNTVQYDNGDNLVLTRGSAVLGKDQCLSLQYLGTDGTNAAWVETGRNF